MANTNSIFYQIGTAVKDKINALLNPYTGVADIQNTTTLGTVAEHTQAFGGSTIRIPGLDTSATYVDVEYKVGGGSSAAATFSSGNLIITTDGSGTILDAIDVINSTLSSSFRASIAAGTGGDPITAIAASPFTDGTSVSVRKNLTIAGDLTVSGSTTTVDTTTLTVTDNIINLSKGASDGAYTNDSGLYFERGSGSESAFLVYDESQDKFVLGETSGASTDTTLTASASDAGRGTLQVGKVEVYDDVTTSFKEVGSLYDFTAGLAS